MFKSVEAVTVSIWGRRVGVVTPGGGAGICVFEYDPDFLTTGIELAPLAMPLAAGPRSFPELPQEAFHGLPAMLADSLPDSFGNMLIDAWMAEQGVDRQAVTPLDRLAYLGKRGMGALEFEPVRGPQSLRRPTVLEMSELVEAARRAVGGSLRATGTDLSAALRNLIQVGSSAGGAQAKAVIGWNRDKGGFCSGQFDLPKGYEHWIIKFCPADDAEAGVTERAYALMAAAAGLDVPPSALLVCGGRAHFMSRRFDRDGNRKLHLQTLAAMSHLPPTGGAQAAHSYNQLFMAADRLGLGFGAKVEIFRRMTFNVLAKNCDDHAKNFSFLLSEGGTWHLAPAYDLTRAYNSAGDWDEWENCHALSVNGRFSGITADDLRRVADRFAVGTADADLSRVASAVAAYPDFQKAARKEAAV